MKIALIGATGFVGTAVRKEALERGHEVTAITRDASRLSAEEGLTVVQADVSDASALSAALSGHDVVVSAFNAGWTNPDLYHAFLSGSKIIQEAVKKSGVKRYLVVGGAGSLFVAPGVQLVDTPEFPAEWKPGALAARDYLNVLKEEKELDWTFLSPAIEMHQGTSGEKRGTYRTGTEQPVFDEKGRSVLSVEDLALAIVDEVENANFAGRRFTVAY